MLSILSAFGLRSNGKSKQRKAHAQFDFFNNVVQKNT